MTGITEIIRQVTSYRKIYSVGYHHLILGRTINLPANLATPGLQRGSSKEARSPNGKRPRHRIPLCGFTENVRQFPALTPLETNFILPFRSGCGKKRFLVRQILDILVSGAHCVGQLHDYRGH
jgi:hypothetical protein